MGVGCEEVIQRAGRGTAWRKGQTRKSWLWVGAVTIVLATPGFARAETVSYTGTLPSPQDVLETTVNVNAGDVLTLQTYGFGGGVNADGTTIAAGGFDAFVGVFSGTGDGAVFVNGTSDVLTNYTLGCPPAGTAAIGSVPGQCGDVTLQLNGLSAGMYTVLLSDGAYLPAAVFESGGTLGDGFFDLTGGAFQTCVDANNCNDDTGNWALDVTTASGSPAVTPEPASVELAGTGALLLVGWMYRKERNEMSKPTGKEG